MPQANGKREEGHGRDGDERQNSHRGNPFLLASLTGRAGEMGHRHRSTWWWVLRRRMRIALPHFRHLAALDGNKMKYRSIDNVVPVTFLLGTRNARI